MKKKYFYKWPAILISIIFMITIGCSSGSGSKPKNVAGAGSPPDIEGIKLKVETPTIMTAPFCVRIKVSGADFAPIIADQTYPAGTESVETVVPNIPAGDNRIVELGLFESGRCALVASADWYGIAGVDPTIQVSEGGVTLVELQLAQQSPLAGTGSIIIRGNRSVVQARLHGEVVTGKTMPVGNATCDIFETQDGGPVNIGTVVSGVGAADLGVLNSNLELGTKTTELLLRCSHPDFSPASRTAMLVTDPTNPAFGTFTATVQMDRGVNVELVSSTETGMEVIINIPPATLKTVATSAGEFQRFETEMVALSLTGGGAENFSKPEVPVFSVRLAVPIVLNEGNAIATTNTFAVDSFFDVFIESVGDVNEVQNVRLYPVQKPARDANVNDPEYTQKPDVELFEFNPDIYGASPVSILSPVSVEKVGGNEETKIVEIKFNLVDWDPTESILKTHSKLRIKVNFITNTTTTPCFRLVKTADGHTMDAVDNLVERSSLLLHSGILNPEMLRRTCPYPIFPLFFGARLIIVTHPDFVAAANDLRNHKIAMGISTVVKKTSDITATTGSLTATAAEIKTYLRNAYAGWFITPKWLLLLGDAEFIPTHYGTANSWDNANNAGDIYYGQFTADDTAIPVFGIGRFPVDTNIQAQVMVDKVKNFENSPPPSGILDNPYYSRLAFAAQFQDNNLDGQAERWFAETSENIRNYLATQNMRVDRIYSAPGASSPTLWRDGGAVPLALRKPGFPWNGSTADIINTTNDGRSIVYHRDHGWWNGWGTPSFSTGDLSSISVTGTEFPVIYSINCASGIFDNETDNAGYGSNAASVYWAESYVRQADGAIAVIGDTRSSATTLNNDMAIGLFDATWPNYKPFGSSSVIKKLGDILNHGKDYVKSKPYSTSAIRQELKIYNLLGDPTVEVKSRRPRYIVFGPVRRFAEVLIVSVIPETCLTCPPFELQPIIVVAQGMVNGVMETLGRGVANKGSVEIPVGNFQGEIVLTASGSEIVPVETTLPGLEGL